MNKRTVSQSNGFTLIELLVVISIITLLVGILLPAAAAEGRHGSRFSSALNMAIRRLTH